MAPELDIVIEDHPDPVIDRAIAFIDAKAKEYAEGLALDVGEHLWIHVWQRNMKMLTTRNRLKENSMHRIAAATGYSYDELRYRVIAALTREKLAKMGLQLPGLDLSHFAQLYELREHPRAAKALARWAHEQDLSVSELSEHVTRWRNHLDKGGQLADLKRDPHHGKKKKKKKKGPKRPPRSNDELMTVRLLMLVEKWLKLVSLGQRQKLAILGRLRVLRQLLNGGVS
jgi:hypothetical protein